MATKESEVGGPAAGTALTKIDDDALEQIRRHGRFQIARRDTVKAMYNQIAGCEWGTGNQLIRGEALSPATRAVLANFCVTVGAHPQLHVNLLGGKPYLNAEYWSDRLNTETHFIDYELHNISANPERRAHYGAPEWATNVYECVIRKLVAFAPIEKIRNGEITDWQQYVVEVREANWAGNKPKMKKKGRDGGGEYEYDPDPVGNADPAKTARTRSLRRTAVRTFPAWMQKYEAEVKKAEEFLEAEYEIIQDDRREERAALPQIGQPQAVRSGGEPEAASADGARELPVRGEVGGPGGQVPQAAATEPAGQAQPATMSDAEKKDAQGKFFATLKDGGHGGDKRKPWMVAHGLGDSTKAWDRAAWDKALQAVDRELVEPVRADVIARAFELGVHLEPLTQDLLGKEFSRHLFLVDWNALAAKLQEIADDL